MSEADVEQAVLRVKAGAVDNYRTVVVEYHQRLRASLVAYCPPGVDAGELAHLSFIQALSEHSAVSRGDEFVSFYTQDRLLTLKYAPTNSDAIEAIMAQLKREEDPFVRAVLEGIREEPAPVRTPTFSLGQWIERLIPTRGW